MTKRLALLLLLLACLAAPAWARLVIGVTPAVTPGAGDRRTLDDCAELLGNQLGEAVYLRSIDSETLMLDWLARFRELDAALISSQAFAARPAGDLVKVVDLAVDGGPALIVVTYAGQAPERIERLRGMAQLPRTEPGRRLLQRAGQRQPAATEPTIRAALALPVMPPVQVKALPPVSPVSSPASARPAPAVSPPQPAPAVEVPPPSTPAVAPAPVVAPPTSPAPKPAAVTPAPAPPETIAAAPSTPPATATPAPAAAPPAKSSRLRLVFFVSLVLITGILLKLALLVRHWRQTRAAKTPIPPPAAFGASKPAAPAVQPPPAAIASLPAEPPPLPLGAAVAVTELPPIPANLPELPPPWENPAWSQPLPPLEVDEILPLEEFVSEPESGRLDAATLPHLLRHCAALDNPAVISIRTPHRETRLHFTSGQISHVAVGYPGAAVTFADKTGQLMARDNLLSAAKLEQALTIVRRDPANGLSTALHTVGVLDPEGFRATLTRHAKTQLFFLLLFPEGDYRLEPDTGSIPQAEQIALEIDALLSDADYHQAEWAAIRKELPGLATVMEILPDGRGKLEKIQLSPAQLELLEKIDGRNSLDALCATTTLPDYEACRFLYMMTRVGVLNPGDNS